MPFWLYWAITGLTVLTAFKCPKCQDFNRPNKPEVGHVIDAIRKTPVINGHDSIWVTLMHYAHEDFKPYYEQTAVCSKLRADTLWENLNFYMSDSKVIRMPNGDMADAYFERVSLSIVLAYPNAANPQVIRHEILHALMWHFKGYPIDKEPIDSIDFHPDSMFGMLKGKCAGLVRPH